MYFLASLLVLFANEMIGVRAQSDQNEKVIIDLAHPYENDFHIVFGMITSTVLIMLAFLSIAVVSVWTMDPGRDSIIYRMTSQKIKKND